MLLLLAGARQGVTSDGVFDDPSGFVFSPNVIPTDAYGQWRTPERAYFGSAGRVYRRLDIWNSDGTPFYLDAPLVEGSVSVDMNRDERRTLEFSLDNESLEFRSDPEGFWYDKIIKVYRGVENHLGEQHYFQLGEFLIDSIDEPHFPPVVSVTARDRTKQLMLSKFSAATQFGQGDTLEAVIAAIAGSAGVTRRNFPATGITLDREFYWEAATSRWDAVKELATAYGYELFFDPGGTFVMRLFVDPTTAAVLFTFLTGTLGNLSSYSLSTNDTRIFNHVLVTGTATNQLPVYGVAENNQTTSPTRIARLGRRTYPFDSAFVATSAQAKTLAESLLRVMALESYELSLDALVAPWLEAGVAVEFRDPDPVPSAPTRFLLSNFEIPLTLGTMAASARRVTMVI